MICPSAFTPGTRDWNTSLVIYDREDQTYNIWHFMIDAAHQRKGYGKAALAQVIRYIKTKPFGPSGTVLLTCSPENQAAYALYTDFWLLPNGTVRRKGTGALPEARPGAAEYGDKSIIRQQKTRPAPVYFGGGRVFIVEKPPVLHMRAKPCITGMRAGGTSTVRQPQKFYCRLPASGLIPASSDVFPL